MQRTLVTLLFILLGFIGVINPIYPETLINNEKVTPSYIPGLGEIMGYIQLRHAKLWLAGINGNWDLAHYELGELKEGFDNAQTYQPDFKGKPIKEIINPLTNPALNSLDQAISKKDFQNFKLAFNKLTHACNACHQSTGYKFIQIQTPSSIPITNQHF
ncbi:hypothetical protein [Ferrovum sp. PN-J185]|uniref:hypothetical protein n=1 Tax=Ferrovum sp. PN-J185 TaxID=1356306 RepID=UPI0007959F34|nr:hypothetical protein [Ferrovum sp. PN-J185]KXW55474.1 hypothetical protein FV185_12410 [Ferrovum sp. PN-J185]